MEYDPARNNLYLVTRPGNRTLKALLDAKAEAGQRFWTNNSVRRTGYNATHVTIVDGESPDGDDQSIILATGYYAKWRILGSRYAGASAPERTFERAIGDIREAGA